MSNIIDIHSYFDEFSVGYCSIGISNIIDIHIYFEKT